MRFSKKSYALFTLHARPEGDVAQRAASIIAIGHEFSWPAFFFGPLWLLWSKLWFYGLIFAGFDGAVNFLTATGRLSAPAGMFALIAASCYVALEGPEWRRRRAERKGLALTNIVMAADADQAEAQMLRAWEPSSQIPTPGLP